MMTEQQVLQLYNSVGVRTASSAKPRLVTLSRTGLNALNFGNANNEKYYFLERVVFAFEDVLPRPSNDVNFGLICVLQPFAVDVTLNTKPVFISPMYFQSPTGIYMNSKEIEPYLFVRSLQYRNGVNLSVCNVLLWEIEE